MDESTLHEFKQVMVDKVSVVFCIILGNICSFANVPFSDVKMLTQALGLSMGCSLEDVNAVWEFTEQMAKAGKDDSKQSEAFMSKHKATDEQMIKHLWPNRKVS